jgi:Tol biopolymer transport system component
LFWRAANGGGPDAALSGAPIALPPLAPMSWRPDGGLAFMNRGDLWLLPRLGDDPRPIETTPFVETTPAFSPDGRWLAYASDETGRFEVYVRPWPGPGQKYLVSSGGGGEPVWARNGRELFFRNGDQMLAVDVTPAGDEAFTASRPRVLFAGSFTRGGGGRTNYDVSPDGRQFVMLNSGEEERAATQISVVLNFFDELARRVPVR